MFRFFRRTLARRHLLFHGGVLLLVLALGGCRGLSDSSSNTPPPIPPPPTQPPPPPTQPPPPPTQPPPPPSSGVVVIAAGANITGINLTVKPQIATLNIQDLGVTSSLSDATAFTTGDRIARGANMYVVLFGPGLDPSQTVTISGPNDIVISDVFGIQSTGGLPGLQFSVAVSPNAALGGRTVYVRAANGDRSGFTGGLEVTP